jgi:hypothetical protein
MAWGLWLCVKNVTTASEWRRVDGREVGQPGTEFSKQRHDQLRGPGALSRGFVSVGTS